MRFYAFAATAAALMITAGAAAAQVVLPPDTVVHVGSAVTDWLVLYVAAIGSVVGLIASWALFKFTGIKMEANARNALETFVTNAAGGFLAKFETIKVADLNVNNELIARLANDALNRVPDALKQFGLGPEDVKRRIVEKIGILTAVPASVPAVVTPPVQ